jgi:hypothetical protein
MRVPAKFLDGDAVSCALPRRFDDSRSLGPIADVIITHVHWDHAARPNCFPTLRLAATKVRVLRGRRWQPLHDAIDSLTACLPGSSGQAGKLTNGDARIWHHRVHRRKHTYASHTSGSRRELIVLAPTILPLREPGSPVDLPARRYVGLAAQDRMKRVAATPDSCAGHGNVFGASADPPGVVKSVGLALPFQLLLALGRSDRCKCNYRSPARGSMPGQIRRLLGEAVETIAQRWRDRGACCRSSESRNS